MGPYQEPAIPGFSVSITIPIPNEGLDDSNTDSETQGCAKFDSDTDTRHFSTDNKQGSALNNGKLLSMATNSHNKIPP